MAAINGMDPFIVLETRDPLRFSVLNAIVNRAEVLAEKRRKQLASLIAADLAKHLRF